MDATAQPLTNMHSVASAAHGKSAQSVGHMAKAAVAEARATGLEMPRNAQGQAASAIAKGADPASVFAARAIAEPDAPDVSLPLDDPTETPASPAETGYAEAASITTTSAADTALAMLKDTVTV